MWSKYREYLAKEGNKEKVRYDLSAISDLEEFLSSESLDSGLNGIPELHLPPFFEYYHEITKQIKPHHKVLELAAGTGRHTPILVETGAEVYAIDISDEALKLLRIRTKNQVQTICASIDNIPLESHSIDFVVSCGGMSYVSNASFPSEITRLLKASGGVILIDSLNHNFVYRVNRFIHFLRGHRTFPTLYRMPTLGFLAQIRSSFKYSTIKTFGNFLWLQHFSIKYFGTAYPKILGWLESRQKSRGAFKFVLSCRKLAR